MRKTFAALAAALALVAALVVPTGPATAATPAVAAATPAVAAARQLPPVRVMPLGDSITYGIGSPTRSGYRIPLYRGLRSAGARIDMVGTQTAGACCYDANNEGHPGWTCGGLLYGNGQPGTGIDYWMNAYRPNVVLLHCGTNDIRPHILTRPDVIAWRLGEIIRRIHAHNPTADVFVARPIVVHQIRITARRAAAHNRRLAAYDRFIPGVVARAGTRTHLVDMRYATGRAGMADALHPDDAGYWQMARRWYAALHYYRPDLANW